MVCRFETEFSLEFLFSKFNRSGMHFSGVVFHNIHLPNSSSSFSSFKKRSKTIRNLQKGHLARATPHRTGTAPPHARRSAQQGWQTERGPHPAAGLHVVFRWRRHGRRSPQSGQHPPPSSECHRGRKFVTFCFFRKEENLSPVFLYLFVF